MFGLEIEMAGIKRKDAARTVKKVLGTHKPVRKERRDTYVFEDCLEREWKFEQDVSICDTASNQTELITPILTLDDMPQFEKTIAALKRAGAVSSDMCGCGIHMHISGEGHNARTLRNWANIMKAHEEQLFRAFSVTEFRIGRYCKRTEDSFIERINQEKPKTLDKLADIWYETNMPDYQVASVLADRNYRYNVTRAHALNLHAFFTRYHTIELRYGQWTTETSLDWIVLKSFILVNLAINRMARLQKFVSPRRPQTVNDAAAFRDWLLKLGFVGDATKDVRRFLLRHFETVSAGNTASAMVHVS